VFLPERTTLYQNMRFLSGYPSPAHTVRNRVLESRSNKYKIQEQNKCGAGAFRIQLSGIKQNIKIMCERNKKKVKENPLLAITVANIMTY
jgi:hypothetical protein